mmetsp:Transcript_82237/g.228217  ORF Transcript_82237/g.228217 Transcript_82237/m.228217 type:complete len:113 (+) Transcript_82237:274-612(+)
MRSGVIFFSSSAKPTMKTFTVCKQVLMLHPEERKEPWNMGRAQELLCSAQPLLDKDIPAGLCLLLTRGLVHPGVQELEQRVREAVASRAGGPAHPPALGKFQLDRLLGELVH